MRVKKLLYYDVFGPEENIYAVHNITHGFMQPYQHFHSKYELTFVISSNESSVFCNGHTYRCIKPHIRLYKPYSFHIASVTDDEIYDRYVIYFNEKSIESVSGIVDIKQLYSENFAISPLKDEALVCAKHLAEAVVHGSTDRNMQCAAFAGLLSLAARYKSNVSGEINGETNSEESYIGKVLEYISKNFDKSLTATEISKLFYISEQKLCADFKAYMNETLHHYLVSLKVANAAKMIARGSSSMIAASECGFVDESHFSKTFKSRIGLTPYQFKKSLISEIEYGRN